MRTLKPQETMSVTSTCIPSALVSTLHLRVSPMSARKKPVCRLCIVKELCLAA